MPKGLDTTANCGPLAPQLKDAGYDFVARYYAHTGSKRLSVPEAKLVSAAGLQIVVVWETAPTKAAYFSRARGVDDGTSAYHAAQLLGQPAGSAIYFAVDYDASQATISGAISDYFCGIIDGFATIADPAPPAYRIGVYGSGATCAALVGHGLAALSWLAQSTGWAGYKTYTTWNIKQGKETEVLGIDIDSDEAVGDYGAFVVAV
jgi:Rv2525c-like, glycoside hydrolase-like domain